MVLGGIPHFNDLKLPPAHLPTFLPLKKIPGVRIFFSGRSSAGQFVAAELIKYLAR